jgi:putative spermidine/putrescine transport system ATP-binding protein
MSAIKLSGLTKTFGSVVAVDSISLDIHEGEFLTLLGPSGSGKTTVLRMIAGFETPTAGTILLSGQDVTALPANERDVNTVFQDYALFPHMTVQENVEYGLKVKKVAKATRAIQARDALESVALGGYGDRKPSQLSGGQRQRVALARALVNRPKVLLLDEPLGALDLKLRQQMQHELKELQREVGITFVFVTHDQEEALVMSDRIAVFNAGRIEQVGSASEVYEHPTTQFVSTFVGTANVLSGESAISLIGREGNFSIRPEKISIDATNPHAHQVRGTVGSVEYLGPLTRYTVVVASGLELVVLEQNDADKYSDVMARGGREVTLSWQSSAVQEMS